MRRYHSILRRDWICRAFLFSSGLKCKVFIFAVSHPFRIIGVGISRIVVFMVNDRLVVGIRNERFCNEDVHGSEMFFRL